MTNITTTYYKYQADNFVCNTYFCAKTIKSVQCICFWKQKQKCFIKHHITKLSIFYCCFSYIVLRRFCFTYIYIFKSCMFICTYVFLLSVGTKVMLFQLNETILLELVTTLIHVFLITKMADLYFVTIQASLQKIADEVFCVSERRKTNTALSNVQFFNDGNT